MLLEMHCHTAEHSSCSSLPAIELVRQVFAKGLQGIVLTDHHYLWTESELRQLRRSAGVPDHFLILAGQELRSAEMGDVLVYGATESLERGTSLAEVRRLFPEAALVWAHPYRGTRTPSPDDLIDPLIDGIEIFNTNHTARGNSRALQDWHRYRFTAIAGTDTHGSGYAGVYPTIFDHPVTTVAELAREIRLGRCRPFLKEIPRSGAHALVTEVTIGTKGQDEQRERIIIRAIDSDLRWRSAERAFRITQALADHGFAAGRYRVPQPIDADPASRTLIEQGLRGKSLFDKLVSSPADDWQEYYELAARWLARLHSLQARLTPADEFLPREEQRLARYLGRFTDTGHKHARKVSDLVERVLAEERLLLAGGSGILLQGHGDYHPKNVFIGQDSQENRSTLFVAAIDFESSLLLPPAFDVGCFLAQFRNQLFHHPDILAALSDELFLLLYEEERGGLAAGFLRQVELFRARTNLSIAAYLVKVGMGESEDLWRVLVEAERALTNL
ncbi:phosphotransferase [Geobacter pelophilus]|uniref:Phosphotransferase n=1 Tax=Geoanaerobacter pelophilus TaxID=60036 RepID=A0AAW4L9C3_9BACT|nr:phosphotransferase [Geoanaerobacter pelophilus]MBT0666147.1 phosphotransferase [Geoanaerobacter pelophilus]